jgi:hypothetical protein
MFWMILAAIVFLMALSKILDSRFGGVLAERMGGRVSADVEKLLVERIQLLEGEIERLGGDVHRLREESDFLHELIAERPPKEALPPGDDPD